MSSRSSCLHVFIDCRYDDVLPLDFYDINLTGCLTYQVNPLPPALLLFIIMTYQVKPPNPDCITIIPDFSTIVGRL